MTKDTKLPPYLPYPRFLLEADMAQAAKLVYMVLLDRATLSQANGWTDEDGKLYLVFPIEGIANAIDRSPMTVKTALAELENAGLIERQRRGFSAPNHIYVKIPDGQDIIRLTDKKLSVIGKETCPSDGKKTVPMMDRKLVFAMLIGQLRPERSCMTDNEKKLIQARHRLEEAQARDRVKQRKARTRRLIQEGAVLEKALPQTVSMSLNELETYLHELTN